MNVSRVVGVDAAGGRGWVGVVIDDDGFCEARAGALAEIVSAVEPVAVVGVDIPIGNLSWGGRSADREARRRLGSRSSSLYSPPPLEVLEVDDYDRANQCLVEQGRPKVTRQAWALRTRMLETARLACHDDRLIEVHPELSFRELAGSPLEASKKTWTGHNVRRRLLLDAGIGLPDDLDTAGLVSPDDVLDAAVAAWSARRHRIGAARPVPGEAEYDTDGRRLAIWY